MSKNSGSDPSGCSMSSYSTSAELCWVSQDPESHFDGGVLGIGHTVPASRVFPNFLPGIHLLSEKSLMG
jgi:hypothetical protein